MPRLQKLAEMNVIARNKKGKLVTAPIHPNRFAEYAQIKILALICCVWGIFLYLLFSTGWRDPFAPVVNWYGISAPGWLFDLVYGRANNAPNGAHLLSWIGVAGFGLTVCYKAMPWKPQRFFDLLADPFQGIAALLFLGGVHEFPWAIAYYAAYWQYLSWSVLIPVLRDMSFVAATVIWIVMFWKYPNRAVPLKIFKWPIVVYLGFLAAWFFVPALFGYHLLPITTLNNPNFGVGPYQETPFFSWWWVNALEVISWVILWLPSIIQVVRYHGDNRAA
jgi:hypothetical protein